MEQCLSYILNVTVKNDDGVEKTFVVNRNDTWMDTIIGTPEYIKWFEIPETVSRRYLLKSNKVDILETIGLLDIR